eukprot:gnl/TRDRNA2_/TRDRNA2_188303_c0_seq1.p1 gnl/TRDRNA2_/TRDRNA2_188303_c0~~gnl/TRDRNA2_/TRDRNA2_188303_c0_seq1.p1  ORF type:complete len:442 (-),score=52.74 gnl/TRDRNA2_/TRDRNA2_188303_c0_seq1:72-1397(-)
MCSRCHCIFQTSLRSIFFCFSLLPLPTTSSENNSCLLQRQSARSRLNGRVGKLCKLRANELALTEDHMREALSLGSNYMLSSMRPSGEFVYEFDYEKGRETEDDDFGDMVNPVREACGVWGLSLMLLDAVLEGSSMPRELLDGLRRSLNFFAASSRSFDDGRRVVVYPGLEAVPGKTGTVAVLALAHIDFLRTSLPVGHEREKYLNHLTGLLKSLKSSVKADGRVHRKYRNNDGHFFREHSPHFDGEVLLAFVKAAKYLDFEEYWPTVRLMVDAGWKKNVKNGLRAGTDNENMKGYYQWSSMAWYELLTSSHADEYSAFRHRIVKYGLWIVNKHKLLKRTRNFGYAFEGLIPAFLIAKDLSDWDALETLGCAIDRGMRKVSSMQLGHPLATGLAKHARLSNRTRGGVQDAFKETKLRIDTTEHQMHAAILARRLLGGHELI